MRIDVELGTHSDTLRVSIEHGSWPLSLEPNQSSLPTALPNNGLRLIAVEGLVVDLPAGSRSPSPDPQVDHHWDGLSY